MNIIWYENKIHILSCQSVNSIFYDLRLAYMHGHVSTTMKMYELTSYYSMFWCVNFECYSGQTQF